MPDPTHTALLHLRKESTWSHWGWLGAFRFGVCTLPTLHPSRHLRQQSFCWEGSLSQQTLAHQARVRALKYCSLLQLRREQPDSKPAFPIPSSLNQRHRTLEKPPGF